MDHLSNVVPGSSRLRDASQQPLKPLRAPPGLSVRGRPALAEMSTNARIGQTSTGFGKQAAAAKKKGFTIFQDPENTTSSSSSVHALNLRHAQQQPSSSQQQQHGGLHHSQSAPAFKVFCDPTLESTSSSSRLPLRVPPTSFQLEQEDKENDVSDFWAEPIAKLPVMGAAAPISVQFQDVRSLLPKPSDVFRMDDDEDCDSPMALDATASNAANVSMESEEGDEDIQIEDEAEEDGAVVKVKEREESSEERAMLMSEEYINDIYTHLKEQEIKFAPKWSYMQKQPDISFPMRAILVDWLVEVGEEYKLQQETLHLAVNYIDRFLSIMSVQRAKLQLVGTACMFIAAKYEEIYPPDVGEFVYITDDTYTKKQVLRMEQLVLSALRFDLAAPTVLFYANMFSRLAGSNATATQLAQYIAELTMLEAETFLKFSASEVAAAIVVVARGMTGEACVWPKECADLAELCLTDLADCARLVHEFHRTMPENPQQAIREKYKTERFDFVADIESNPTPFWVALAADKAKKSDFLKSKVMKRKVIGTDRVLRPRCNKAKALMKARPWL